MSFEAGNTVRKVTDVQNVYVQRRVLPSTFCISFTGRLTNVLRKKKNCVLSSNLSDFPSRATGVKIMNNYSLTEHKLRRYVYLGHKHASYIVPLIRPTFIQKKLQDDVLGVEIIGQIVKNNNPEEINSIVPIILKIKKEDKLYDDTPLIFTLAVCSKFALKSCIKMVSDAYAAVSTICTDGHKLLMFIKFCEIAKRIIQNKGYLTDKSLGYGNGLRKAIRNWYLKQDPLYVTKQIIKYPSYKGNNHKKIMTSIHLTSKDPSRQIFIAYTLNGMSKVEDIFEYDLVNNVDMECKKETKQIFMYLKQINELQYMNEEQIKNEIQINKWEPEVIPKNMLTRPAVLTLLLPQYPLKMLLENVFYFSKHKVFNSDKTSDAVVMKFISYFDDSDKLQESQIHPIDSFLQYVRYSRTTGNVMKIQNNILKKQNGITTNNMYAGKLIMNTEPLGHSMTRTVEGSQNQKKKENLNWISTIEYSGKFKQKCGPRSETEITIYEQNEQMLTKCNDTMTKFSAMSIENNTEQTVFDRIQSEVVERSDHINQNVTNMVLMKPFMLSKKLLTFLSEILLNKTLKYLKPTGRRMIISYDSRKYMKRTYCKGRSLMTAHEAVVMIILSLVYPESLENKPTIIDIDEPGMKYCGKVKFDFKNKLLNYATVMSALYCTPFDENLERDKEIVLDVYPASTVEKCIKKEWKYDVFVFLGTKKMNYKNLENVMCRYQKLFDNNPMKVIICCLNGYHAEHKFLIRKNYLFIIGFDETVGHIITSFINDEF